MDYISNLDWSKISTYQTMMGQDTTVVQEHLCQGDLTDHNAINVFIEAVTDRTWATANPKLFLKAISLVPTSLPEARMCLLAALERTQVFGSHTSSRARTYFEEICKAKDWQLLLQLTPLFPLMRPLILHLACRYLAPAGIIEKLIELGCDIHAKDASNNQALNHAALYGNTEAIELLLRKGTHLEHPGRENQTALFMATESAIWDKSTSSLELLLAAGANPNAIDARGKSLLHFCISILSLCPPSEHTVLTTLVRLGININTRNSNGKTALESTISQLGLIVKPISLVRELIALEADTRVRNEKGEGLLHQIANQSHSWDADTLYFVVDMLLLSGLEIEDRDFAGNTPLLTAYLTGNSQMMELLQRLGADIHAKNTAGQTPYRLMMSNSADDATVQATFATKLTLSSSSVWTHHVPGADAVTMAFNKEQCHRVLSDIRNLHAMFASDDKGLKVPFNPFGNIMQPLNYAKARQLQEHLKTLLGIDLVLNQSKKIIQPTILNPHLHDIHLHYPLSNITSSFRIPGLVFADSKDARLIKLLGIHSLARFYSVDEEENYKRFVSSWGVSVMLGMRDFAIASESFTVVNELLKILVLAYEGIINVKRYSSGEIELSILDQAKFGGPLESIVNALVKRYGSSVHPTDDGMARPSSSSSTSEQHLKVMVLRPPASPDEFTDFRSTDQGCNPLIGLIPGSSWKFHIGRSTASSSSHSTHLKTE